MNLEINYEECTICLEIISSTNSIGTIQGCHHYYHEDCILQWSSHSNSCPTCRKLFYKIDVSKRDEPAKIRKLISIRDKLLHNDAIDQIPAEYIIPTYPAHERENNHNALDQITENYSSNNKLCSVCSSSDYRSSLSRNLIYCNNCPSAFHLNCLGIDPHQTSEDFTWCCPMCDSLQDLPHILPYQSRLASNRIRTPEGTGNIRPSAKRIRTPRIVTSLINSHITDSVFRNAGLPINLVPTSNNIGISTPEQSTSRANPRQRLGLIIHNENDELDDDFLYSDANFEVLTTNRTHINNGSYSPPIINGGVILRKELKERQKLSKEEADSWDVFDEARKCQAISESSNVASSPVTQNLNQEPRRRRRRKRPSELTQPVSEQIEGISAELQNSPQRQEPKTRISSLISELRSSSQTGGNSENEYISHPTIVIPDKSMDTQSISLADASSSDVPSIDSDVRPEIESQFQRKKVCRNRPLNLELSLEQKVEIQKHIRNNLKPLYQPAQYNSREVSTIKSEDLYIEINKSASRKIYAHILSLVTNETEESKSSILIDYFNQDETKLKSVVDKFVQDELKYYK